MTLNDILDRARRSTHAAAWGDVAAALLEMMQEFPCGYQEPVIEAGGGVPALVRITKDAVGLYEPNEARAYAAALLRAADEADAQRKLLPNI